MATLRAALRAQVAASSSVEETVFWVNDVLVTDTPIDKFATLFVGLLDHRRLELTYVNAGHNPPLLYDPRDGELKRLSIGGPIIGVFAGARFESGHEQLLPGQVLVAYTDGVTEAEDTNGEMFDVERLEALVRQHANEEAEVLKSRIQKAIVEFSLGTSQHDDITVFVVKVAER